MRRKAQQGNSFLGKAEDSQVKGQLSLFDISISENSKTLDEDVEIGKLIIPRLFSMQKSTAYYALAQQCGCFIYLRYRRRRPLQSLRRTV